MKQGDKKILGLQNYRKHVSYRQTISIKSKVSLANNNYFKKGIDKVIRVEFKQIGEADLYSWELEVIDGRLNVREKVERLRERNEFIGKVSTPITKDTEKLLPLPTKQFSLF